MSMFIEEKTTVITNQTTGELTQTTEQKIMRFPKTPDFVMTFTKDLGYMKELTRAEMLTMFGMLQIVNAENEVILNKAIKERICNEYDLSIKSMDVFIHGLKKKEVIVQVGRGIYKLQPNLFGKGRWSDVKKLRMAIEWDFKHKTKRVGVETEYFSEEELLQQQINDLETKKRELEKELANSLLTPKSI